LFMTWMPPLDKKRWPALFWVSVLGLCVGILPPLLDLLVSGLYQARYTYFFTFEPLFYTFGAAKGGAATYAVSFGEAASIWLTILAAAGYIFIVTRSWWRGAVALVLSWCGIQFFGFVTFGVIRWLLDYLGEGTRPSSAQQEAMVVLVLAAESVVFYLLTDWRRLRSVAGKLLHVLPFALTLGIGGAAVGRLTVAHLFYAVLLLLLTVILIIQNNVFDRREDEGAGRHPALANYEVGFGHVLAVFIILGAIFFRSLPGLLLMTYYLVWSIYHHESLRLKSIFPLAYAIEGVAGSLALICGMALSADNYQLHNIRDAALPALAFFTMLGYGASSVFKDYKDIEGDRQAGIVTLYTLLLGRAVALKKIQWLVFAIVALSHLAVIGLAMWLRAPLWQALTLRIVVTAGFAYLLLFSKHRVLAVEGCLICDSAVLAWLCYAIPSVRGLLG
jgi:4-hydroxybenzoate polyprenyltransferase